MSWTVFDQLITLLPAGCGVVAVGLFHLLARKPRLWVRLTVIVSLAGLLYAGVSQAGEWQHAVLSVGVFLFATAVTAAYGSEWVEKLRRPTVRWTLATLVGVGLATGVTVRYDQADLNNDVDLVALTENSPSSPLVVVEQNTILTDRGKPVVVKKPSTIAAADSLARSEMRMIQTNHREANLIRRSPAYEESNCHGWVFTGGRFWVTGDVVDTILADNGYKPVTDPRPGDIVVYRDGDRVQHTAIVRYQTPGQPVLVEGKWGRVGVFLHAVDQSAYSQDFTYYRSSRTGHQLAGLAPTAN